MGYGQVLRVVGIGAAVAVGAVVMSSAPGQADPAVASATLVDINGNHVGEALFTSNGDGSVKGRMTMVIDNGVTANPAEFHGFHIHANDDDDTGDGTTDDGCVTFPVNATPAQSAWFSQVDTHWNPSGAGHGSHLGDLPSIVRQRDGEATIEFAVDKFAAGQLPGKALVVHFLADDFRPATPTGNAGFRYACGEIVASARAK